MSYLDDPDHEWAIDPAWNTNSLLEDIIILAEKADSDTIELVLQGYEGLRRRHPEATIEECFGTSMVWCFG